MLQGAFVIMELVRQPSSTAPARLRSVWRNRDFLLLFSGQAVSSAGSRITLVAFPLLVLAVTHSPAQAGIVGALRGVPYTLLCLHAGALVDRWDRKSVMVVCDLGRALALGSIPVALALGRMTLLQLYIVALVEGLLFLFFNMADAASLPHVVEKEQITTALAQATAGESVAQIIGQGISGILWSLGRGIPFLTDTISYAASVCSLRFIKADFQEERPPEQSRIRDEIWEGMTWLWQQPILRFLALLTGVLMMCCSGYALILILLAQGMHASPATIGLLFATGGVGSVIGALIIPLLEKVFRFGQIMICAAVIWALTWLIYAVAPNLLWLGIGSVVSFIVVPVYLTTQYGYRLTMIPDRLQGRVNSVFRLIAFGSEPIGIALTGLLLQHLSPQITTAILFVPQIILAGVAVGNRQLWRAGRA